MTNKERLEKCKQFADADDIDWLIRQVEKYRELSEIYMRQKDRQVMQKNIAHDKNEEYREALEFYADKGMYEERTFGGLPTTAVDLDGGSKARNALKEAER